MDNILGKWEQHSLLRQNALVAKRMPKTILYSHQNVVDFVNRFQDVYVKHDVSGQGRGIFKVSKRSDGYYCFNGFSLQGKPIHQCVKAVRDIQKILHPMERLGRVERYIVQEGVPSVTYNGLLMYIRVHVQYVKGEWNIGGMNAKIGTPETSENGILNYYRGSEVISIDELLSVHLKLNDLEKAKILVQLKEIAIAAAETIALHYPDKEYGVDLGLTAKKEPVFYELNRNPCIKDFAEIDNKATLRKIMENRKLQKRENQRNDE
ncbi:YheC/YheD family protein [Sporosarcina sp. HYO08]|uniref:YheC/YheD family protein n=1 Tax=Sporosarcina sp. HYO08 TaxID=1759557 RepID=UPI0007956446|nr:YheC/YheD family protein [Sporosarcina sp. HYO08]KXH81842.1 hypothetical protein AU377_06145 [Sporosarcina sp. HYO08]